MYAMKDGAYTTSRDSWWRATPTIKQERHF